VTDETPCSCAGCGRPAFVKSPGYGFGPLCNGHYKQLKTALRRKNPLALVPLRPYGTDPTVGEPCAYEGCGRRRKKGSEYCLGHDRMSREGDLRPIRRHEPQNGACSVEGCGRQARAKGLCAVHYSRMRNQARKETRDE
jgi:hypothetical protein